MLSDDYWRVVMLFWKQPEKQFCSVMNRVIGREPTVSTASETTLAELIDQIEEDYKHLSGSFNLTSATSTVLSMDSMLKKVKNLAIDARVENTSIITADYMTPDGHTTLKNYRSFRSESELKVILNIFTEQAASLWVYPVEKDNWIISIDANSFNYVSTARQIAPDAPVFEGEHFLNLSFQVTYQQAVTILKAFAAL